MIGSREYWNNRLLPRLASGQMPGSGNWILWPPRQWASLLFLTLAGLGLTGCQTQPRVIERLVQLPAPSVPSALLMPCLGPTKPGGEWTQRTLILIADQLLEALDLCNADKAAIRAVLDAEKPKTKLN